MMGKPPHAALFRDPDDTRLQKKRLPPSPLRGFPCPSALSAPSARARLISQITSRKVPRPPLPSDLPGSYRLSAPAGRSSSHPGAINAPKSSFPWRSLNEQCLPSLRGCRWGGCKSIRVEKHPGHVGARHPGVPRASVDDGTDPSHPPPKQTLPRGGWLSPQLAPSSSEASEKKKKHPPALPTSPPSTGSSISRAPSSNSADNRPDAPGPNSPKS